MKITFFFLPAFIFTELFSGGIYNAELLEQITTCVVRNDHLTIDRSYRIRINNSAGNNYSKITIPYRKKEPVSIEDAWIENKYGQIVRKLGKKEITTRSDISEISMYEDSYVDQFTLLHNDYPYVIYYKYTQTVNEFFEIIHWSPIFNQDIPSLKANLSVRLPKKYKVLIHENKIAPCVSDQSDNESILTWSADYKEPFREEEFSASYLDYYPSVRIVPVNFSYSTKGSFKDAISYGNWKASLLEGAQNLPPSEADKVHRLTMKCKNNLEKVRTLYHYLQDNTRYINVSIDIGGWKPYPASYVADRKYGDCKALSNYMCSILKVAGINSYYTNIYAGEIYPEPDTLISRNLFNHIIVCVPLEKDTIWLECTSNTSPMGYLGTFTQNRYGFIIEKNNSRFIHTPCLNYEDVKNSRKLEFLINGINGANGKLSIRLRGDDFDLMNTNKSFIPKEYQGKWIDNLFDFKDYTIQNWNFKEADRDSAFIDLNIDLDIRGFIKSYGNIMIINQIRFPVPDFESPDKRKLDVLIPYPIYVIDTIEYSLPKVFSSISLPSDTLISSKYGSFQRETLVVHNKTIIVRKSLKISSSRYLLNEYVGFYGFIESIKNEGNKIMTIKN